MAKARVVVLGGGVGGTFIANKLTKHSDKVKITVVDATGVHLLIMIDATTTPKNGTDGKHKNLTASSVPQTVSAHCGQGRR